MNHEVRKKNDKSFSRSTSVEASTARGVGSNHRKGKGDFRKSKAGGREDLKKNQCVFYKEERYWRLIVQSSR